MEKIIYDKISDFIQCNKIIQSFQHGFVKRKSCFTNLLEVSFLIAKSLDNKNCVDVVYLDFEKAFDKVIHSILLRKMCQLNFPKNIIRWIEIFLKERTFCVHLNGYSSNEYNVLSGVPQGSILGPILFLIYIHDFPSFSTVKLSQFADDTKLFTIVNSIEDCKVLQNCLDKISTYCAELKISINVKKSAVLHFGHKNLLQNYEIDGQLIPQTEEYKDLGVVFTSEMKFSEQCERTARKCFQTIYLVKHGFNYLDKNSFLVVYKSIIRSKLEYNQHIWSPYLEKDIIILEKVQRKSTKLLWSLRKTPYEERLKFLDLTTLQQRRKRGDLIEYYKILKGYYDINAFDFFTFATDEFHSTRGHSMKLKIPSVNTNIFKNHFCVRSLKAWNSLPEFVVSSESIAIFKRRLDEYWSTC